MASVAMNELSGLIPTLNDADLDRAIEQAQHEKKKRQEVTALYGKLFSETVGIDNIYRLPIKPAETLKLGKDNKYPENIVHPSMLGEHSAVRGIMGSNRPFIAIKIEMLDPTTKAVIDVAVELIFRRNPLTGDNAINEYYGENYVTALSNFSIEGTRYDSTLYSSGGMSMEQLEAVRELLDGKEIPAPIGDKWIRMAKSGD